MEYGLTTRATERTVISPRVGEARGKETKRGTGTDSGGDRNLSRENVKHFYYCHPLHVIPARANKTLLAG